MRTGITKHTNPERASEAKLLPRRVEQWGGGDKGEGGEEGEERRGRDHEKNINYSKLLVELSGEWGQRSGGNVLLFDDYFWGHCVLTQERKYLRTTLMDYNTED